MNEAIVKPYRVAQSDTKLGSVVITLPKEYADEHLNLDLNQKVRITWTKNGLATVTPLEVDGG